MKKSYQDTNEFKLMRKRHWKFRTKAQSLSKPHHISTSSLLRSTKMDYFSRKSSKVKKLDGKILFAKMNLNPIPFLYGLAQIQSQEITAIQDL